MSRPKREVTIGMPGLRKVRKEVDLTTEDLGRELWASGFTVTGTQLYRVESGVSNPSIPLVFAILSVLRTRSRRKVTLDELFIGAPDPLNSPQGSLSKAPDSAG